jgi:hypothetical protein
MLNLSFVSIVEIIHLTMLLVVQLRSEICKLIHLFGKRKNLLISGRNLIVTIHKKGNETDCSNYSGISLP